MSIMMVDTDKPMVRTYVCSAPLCSNPLSSPLISLHASGIASFVTWPPTSCKGTSVSDGPVPGKAIRRISVYSIISIAGGVGGLSTQLYYIPAHTKRNIFLWPPYFTRDEHYNVSYWL